MLKNLGRDSFWMKLGVLQMTSFAFVCVYENGG